MRKNKPTETINVTDFDLVSHDADFSIVSFDITPQGIFEQIVSKERSYQKKEKPGPGRPAKYTLEFCRAEVQWMLDFLQGRVGLNSEYPTEQDTKTANSIAFLQQLCHLRGYSHQRWSEWAAKHGADEQFADTTKMIEEILEARLVLAGLSNKVNPLIAIITLKEKYGWQKATEQPPQQALNLNMSFEQLFMLKHGRKPSEDEIKGLSGPKTEEGFAEIIK